jgi:hypothetical protein
MLLRQFPTADCRLAKNVSHEAAKPRGRSNAALYRCFNHSTTQVVRVMPDFKAVVFVKGQLPFTVACSFDAVNSAFDGQCWVMFSHNVLA